MPRNRVPERNPVGDSFTGAIIQIDAQFLLTTPHVDLPDSTPVKHQGDFTVRYGFAYLGKPHLAIVPGILALDYGDMLTGDEAFTFIQKKSNLHPRADVVGYRNDGEDDMITIKWLDLALPIKVLVYETDTATRPLMEVSALIAPEDVPVSERVATYLPRYATIQAWQAESGTDE